MPSHSWFSRGAPSPAAFRDPFARPPSAWWSWQGRSQPPPKARSVSLLHAPAPAHRPSSLHSGGGPGPGPGPLRASHQDLRRPFQGHAAHNGRSSAVFPPRRDRLGDGMAAAEASSALSTTWPRPLRNGPPKRALPPPPPPPPLHGLTSTLDDLVSLPLLLFGSRVARLRQGTTAPRRRMKDDSPLLAPLSLAKVT